MEMAEMASSELKGSDDIPLLLEGKKIGFNLV
jgi:hypothetical protein